MKKVIVILCTTLMLFACSQGNKSGKSSKEELKTSIQSYEDTLYNQDNFAYLNDALVEKAISTYMEYADSYPKDEMAPEYLFKAANLYRYKRKFYEALEIYNRIESNYPAYDKTPQCLFLQAFIFENELGNLDQARTLYELFLEKYPDDVFAKDARHCLDNLGKPLDEIIKDFETTDEAES